MSLLPGQSHGILSDDLLHRPGGRHAPWHSPLLLSMHGDTPLPLKKLDQPDRMFTEKIHTVKSTYRGRTLVSKILACVTISRPAHAVCGQLPYELDPDILLLCADRAAHVIMSSERASSQ